MAHFIANEFLSGGQVTIFTNMVDVVLKNFIGISSKVLSFFEPRRHKVAQSNC
jgi:hypothetical protein